MSCCQEFTRIDEAVLQRGTARAEARFAGPSAGQRTWNRLLRMLERDGVDDYRQ